MSIPAREHLRIGALGEQQLGIVFYGLRHRGSKDVFGEFPFEAWDVEVSIEDALTLGETWEAICWTVTVTSWPIQEQFERSVTASLHALLEAGAVVAWVGLPESFLAPPELFVSELMSGPVLAAVTPDSPTPNVFALDGPLSPMTNDECSALRQATQGLARAHPPGWVRLG